VNMLIPSGRQIVWIKSAKGLLSSRLVDRLSFFIATTATILVFESGLLATHFIKLRLPGETEIRL